jgi:lysophospholipase L1-like esterase
MAKIIVATGSSTTASIDPLNWADRYHQQYLKPNDVWRNYAFGGSVLSDMVAQLPTIDADYRGATSILIMQLGANDLLPDQLAIAHGGSVAKWGHDVADFLSDIQAAKAWTIGLTTLNPRTDIGFNANRTVGNSIVRAFEGGLTSFTLDFAAHPIYGVDDAADNASYYPDGTHPSDVVQQAMADTAESLLSRLMGAADSGGRGVTSQRI